MIHIHYALQTCDIANNVVNERITGTSKTEVSRRCVKSFLNSVEYASKQSDDVLHHIKIIDDHSTEEHVRYLKQLVIDYNKDNMTIEFESLETGGIMNSIRACYEWLSDNGKQLVYQVQDDYLFEESAIFESIDVWFQIYRECDKTESIVTPHNPWFYWATSYRNKVTPRTIFCAMKRYWIQQYDISCSFLTSHSQFVKHWDLYNYFFSIDPQKGINGDLESISLNRILTQKGVLALSPVTSLSLHMQSEKEVDPYVDWRVLWDRFE